jgi:hypothetical protein
MEVLEWLSDPPGWLTAPFGALAGALCAAFLLWRLAAVWPDHGVLAHPWVVRSGAMVAVVGMAVLVAWAWAGAAGPVRLLPTPEGLPR